MEWSTQLPSLPLPTHLRGGYSESEQHATPQNTEALQNFPVNTPYTSATAFDGCVTNQQPLGIVAGCQVQQPHLSHELRLELAFGRR